MVIIKSKATHINPVNGCEVSDETVYCLSKEEVTEDSDNIYVKDWDKTVKTFSKTEYYIWMDL